MMADLQNVLAVFQRCSAIASSQRVLETRDVAGRIALDSRETYRAKWLEKMPAIPPRTVMAATAKLTMRLFEDES